MTHALSLVNCKILQKLAKCKISVLLKSNLKKHDSSYIVSPFIHYITPASQVQFSITVMPLGKVANVHQQFYKTRLCFYQATTGWPNTSVP